MKARSTTRHDGNQRVRVHLIGLTKSGSDHKQTISPFLDGHYFFGLGRLRLFGGTDGSVGLAT